MGAKAVESVAGDMVISPKMRDVEADSGGKQKPVRRRGMWRDWVW